MYITEVLSNHTAAILWDEDSSPFILLRGHKDIGSYTSNQFTMFIPTPSTKEQMQTALTERSKISAKMMLQALLDTGTWQQQLSGTIDQLSKSYPDIGIEKAAEKLIAE